MVKIGDRVKFLNDVGGGVVTGYAGKNTVYVENYDGFEIPYPVSQLVLIDAPEMNRAEKEPVKVSQPELQPKSVSVEIAKGVTIEGKNSPDFYFCFVPLDPKNPLSAEIKLYLVNDSNFTVLYRYTNIKKAGFETIKYGTLQSNSKLVLESIFQNDISDLPDFGFQMIFFQTKENEWFEPVVKRFKINPLKFYKETSFQPNRFFAQNAMVLQISKNIKETEIDKLTEEDFKELIKEKLDIQPEKKTERKRTPEIVEVDLHINELIDNPAGLSNGEILEIQKEKVESELKSAIQSGVKKIVFIHGVGQGVLKQEVVNLLKTKFRKYYFQDASFKEYGYGATMVILRK